MNKTKQIIILLFIAGLAPLVILSFLNYVYTVKMVKETVIEHLNANVQIRAEALERQARELNKDFTLFLSTAGVPENTAALINSYKNFGSDSLVFKNDLASFSNVIGSYSQARDVYDFFVISLDGDVIFSLKKESDFMTNLLHGKYKESELSRSFMDALKSNTLVVSDVRHYEPSAKPAMFMAEPLFEDGKIIAVMAIQINLDKMYSSFKHYEGIGDTGETIIATKIDDEALFLNPLRYNKEMAFKHSVKIGSNNAVPIQNAVLGYSGSGVFDDYQNHEVLAAWTYLPTLRVGMVVKQDTSEAFASIYAVKNLAIFIGFVVLLVMLYIIFHISKFITNLDKRKEQYEYAINGTSDGLWDWDLVTNKVFFSERWKGMLGCSDDELTNELESWSSRVHPDDVAQAVKDIEFSQENPGRPYENVHRMRHKNGDWVWILDRGQTIFDAQGKPTRMIGFHTDVTNQKKLEMALKNSKERFEQFMERIPGYVTIKDANDKILYANGAAARFFGKDDATGLNARDVFPEKLMRQLTQIKDKNLNKDYSDNVVTYVTPNNESVTLRVLTFPMTQDDHNVKTGSICTDITDEYVNQAEIVKYQKILEQAPFSIMFTDVLGNIEFANPAFYEITGYSKKEIIGKNPRLLKSNHTSKEEYENIWNTISDGKVWSGKFKNIKKNGDAYWINSLISPIVDSDGKILHYFGLEQIISKEVQLTKDLNEKEELMLAQSRHAAMGEMISMIAHQWRQPIAIIAMSANNMLVDVEFEELNELGVKSNSEDI